MPDYEDMILARQELVEIFEDDPDIYESLIDGDYFEEDDQLDIWLWGAD